MQFTCEKVSLMAGLNIASRTVMQKSALSVIEGILCRASTTGLSFTGYNMETAVTYLIEADVSESGECVFPTRLFSEIIRKLPEGPVTVGVDENYKVSVKAGFAAITIMAESADDYPALPDVTTGKPIRMEQRDLKKLISGTIFAVSDSQARPVHTGVKFELEEDRISAIAVDGFRLARRSCKIEDPDGRKLSFVVPASSLKEVEKILQDSDERCAFTPGRRHILFRFGSATLICRLLEGDFLDWRRVVPVNSPIKMVANVMQLSGAIERVGLIVSEKYKSPVRCLFSEQQVRLQTSTTIGTAQDQCDLAGNGNNLEIGFNVRYLADALRAVPAEEVTLELTNGLSPIVLTPVDKKEDFAYMVLPVRMKN